MCVADQCQPATQGSRLFTADTWQEICRRLKLSHRETDIVYGIFNDKKETDIADNLGISAHTIHTEYERLRKKLQVHTRSGLVLRIVNEYLIWLALQNQQGARLCPNLTAVCPSDCPLAG